MTSIEQQRERVLACAAQWLGTPYHHGARLRGAGADCLTLLAEVYAEAGVIARPELPAYSPQWHLHRSEELYQCGLLEHARQVPAPLPGDIALWQFGRTFSHGAIVQAWPRVIHAYIGRTVELADATDTDLALLRNGEPRPVQFWRPRVWA